MDHRFLREGFEQGLTRLEKLLYFVLVAVSNQDGVSFYSDARCTVTALSGIAGQRREREGTARNAW
jgi:N-glycosylase/DNA lyase